MNLLKYIPLVLILVLIQCKNRPKIEVPLVPANYFVLEEVNNLPDSLRTKFPSWVKPGVKCFGIVALVDSQEEYDALGFAIPCKVVSFHMNGVKCKVIDNVYPYETFGCQAIGLQKGIVWMETDGELYMTKKEAMLALRQKMPKRKHTVLR